MATALPLQLRSRFLSLSFRDLAVGRNPKLTLLRILSLIALCLVVFRYVLLPVRGSGISMQPTFNDGQLGFVNLLAYSSIFSSASASWPSGPSAPSRPSGPRRGDIVAIRMAGTRVVYVKRVIGLPGERVRIAHGIVYANDQPIDEPYVKSRRPWTLPEAALGPDEYFVIGDNRGMRIENHDLGKATRARILGKVLF